MDKRRHPGVVDYGSLAAESTDLKIVTSLAGEYRYVSPACHRLFGWQPAELEGRQEDDFVHPHDLQSLVRAPRSARPSRVDDVPVLVSRRIGSLDRDDVSTCRSNGAPLVVSSVRDITDRQESTISLKLQAFTDPLTGVANRTVLMDRLHRVSAA